MSLVVRPDVAQLRATFPFISAELAAQVPAKPGHRSPTVVNIGMNATALFDHGYRRPKGIRDDQVLTDFQQFMYKHRKKPMPLSAAASLPLSLLDANQLTEDAKPEPLVVLHLMSRLDGGASNERLITSLKASGMFRTEIDNDFMTVSQFEVKGGKIEDFKEMVRRAQLLGIDFFLSNDVTLAEMMNASGIGAGIFMNSPGVGHYDPYETRYYYDDGDGVTVTDFFERHFQRIYEETGGDITKTKTLYFDFVLKTKGKHMSPGPALQFTRVRSALARLFIEDTEKKPFMRQGLITTRDFRGSIAFPWFLSAQGVDYDTLEYVSGNRKDRYAAGAIAMFEDGEAHLQRMIDDMEPGLRPKALVYIPWGEKHLRKKAGKQVIADGRGTVKGGGVERKK